MYLLSSKFRFLAFRLLLSRVAPYYSSLPRTVWLRFHIIGSWFWHDYVFFKKLFYIINIFYLEFFFICKELLSWNSNEVHEVPYNSFRLSKLLLLFISSFSRGTVHFRHLVYILEHHIRHIIPQRVVQFMLSTLSPCLAYTTWYTWTFF